MRALAAAAVAAALLAGCTASSDESQANSVDTPPAPAAPSKPPSQQAPDQEADLSGYAEPSLAERRVEAETEPIETAEDLAALHLEAAVDAGAMHLRPAALNRIAADACLAVMTGQSDIDSAYEQSVATYGAGEVPLDEVRHDVKASLSVAGYYCPQLWDEFQAWEPPQDFVQFA